MPSLSLHSKLPTLQWVATVRRLLHSPSGRVVLLVPLVWALNLVDLLFTLLASTDRDFLELNPIAAPLSGLERIALKLASLTIFTVVLVLLRRRRSAELGCYVVAGVYAILAIIWFAVGSFLLSPRYVQQLLSCL